jgi:hypothetical protein
MVVFHPQKVTGGLPATLTPNAVYFVRVGSGIMIYVADATGSVAYPINQTIITYGTSPPNNNDGNPEGSIYIQLT